MYISKELRLSELPMSSSVPCPVLGTDIINKICHLSVHALEEHLDCDGNTHKMSTQHAVLKTIDKELHRERTKMLGK